MTAALLALLVQYAPTILQLAVPTVILPLGLAGWAWIRSHTHSTALGTLEDAVEHTATHLSAAQVLLLDGQPFTPAKVAALEANVLATVKADAPGLVRAVGVAVVQGMIKSSVAEDVAAHAATLGDAAAAAVTTPAQAATVLGEAPKA